MNKLFHRKKGSALVTTLIFMIVVSIFITVLFTVSVADAKHAALQKNNTQAHYLGRSGVNLGLEKLISMLVPASPGDVGGYLGNDPLVDDITELVEDLNLWANNVSPATVGDGETFTLLFEKENTRGIKIISMGIVDGFRQETEMVTLNLKMLTSLLTHGKATEWYTGNSGVMQHSLDPENGGFTYIGEGVLLEGKANSPSKFPSNGGESIFQASVIQALPYDGVSLMDTNSSSDITFDVEIILFVGGIAINDDTRELNLTISDTLALDKINSSSSVLYVDEIAARTAIQTAGGTDGVGFENPTYYKYFSETTSLTDTGFDYNAYAFEDSTYTKYGIVFFGDKVVRLGPSDQFDDIDVIDRIPSADPNEYAVGYYFFPDGINLNGDTTELNRLIPLDKDDPLVALIESRLRVTISGQPYIWDEK